MGRFYVGVIFVVVDVSCMAVLYIYIISRFCKKISGDIVRFF